MKKISLYLLLTFLLTACGGDSDNDGDTANSNEPAASAGISDDDQGSGGNADNDPGDGNNAGSGSPSFGEPNNSQIRPGVVVSAMGSQCTSNFIYRDTQGNFYIGAAAHCFSPDTNSDVDPCEARNEAIGIGVEIQNAAFLGSLAYTSWQTMQDRGETPGSGICDGNDFALIRIDPRDHGNIHPAARVFEGPTALFTGNAAVGDEVFTYGQSPFSLQSSKSGSIDGQSADGWIYDVSLSSPGVPGDSGSAVLHEDGRALGVLSTLSLCIGLCAPTGNGVVNLSMALGYANATVFGSQLSLVTWSRFSP